MRSGSSRARAAGGAGFHPTNIGVGAVDRDVGAYAAQKARVYDVIQERVKNGTNPRAVAEAIHTALTAASPRLRYPVDGGVKLSLLRRFVPARMFDSSFRKQFRLDERRPVSSAWRRGVRPMRHAE
jgi:hypothetical protein